MARTKDLLLITCSIIEFETGALSFGMQMDNIDFRPSLLSDQPRGGGDFLIKVGTDVRARALGFSGVNFCKGIRLLGGTFCLVFGNF